jgi:hypothetical protein
MSRGPDALTLLTRALLAGAKASHCPLALAASDSRRWSSATFAGMQHRLTLSGTSSPALDAMLAALPETEFALRGHLVADLVVERVRREGDAVTIELEVLTVEER